MRENCDNPGRFVELDQSFHNAIAAATQNVMFSLILAPIMNIILENRKLGSIVPGAMEQTVIDHETVLKAIEAKNPIDARLAMIEHLHRVTQDIRYGTEHLDV
jgi:DNA-binding FadR family transcriptional regulator